MLAHLALLMAAALAPPAAAAAAAAATAAQAAPVPPPPSVAAAFAADGFAVTGALAFGSGVGVAARSMTASINGSAQLFKPAYFVSGSAYEMGFLLGALAEPRVAQMTSTFVEHIVPALISESLDAWLQNSTLAPVYDALCAALADLLESDAARYFAASVAAGAVPPALVDEMHGLADGAKSVNASTPATFTTVATINFGYDMLLALIACTYLPPCPRQSPVRLPPPPPPDQRARTRRRPFPRAVHGRDPRPAG